MVIFIIYILINFNGILNTLCNVFYYSLKLCIDYFTKKKLRIQQNQNLKTKDQNQKLKIKNKKLKVKA